MVKFTTMPAKKDNAIMKPVRRDWLSETPTKLAIPSPIGIVQGQTALAMMPGKQCHPDRPKRPVGQDIDKPLEKFFKSHLAVSVVGVLAL